MDFSWARACVHSRCMTRETGAQGPPLRACGCVVVGPGRDARPPRATPAAHFIFVFVTHTPDAKLWGARSAITHRSCTNALAQLAPETRARNSKILRAPFLARELRLAMPLPRGELLQWGRRHVDFTNARPQVRPWRHTRAATLSHPPSGARSIIALAWLTRLCFRTFLN